MTEPSMFSDATALSTCAWDTALGGKLTVNSVPPAKSMPSAKPLAIMKYMPGMMISSEKKKYQLRRLTKSAFRPRGGAGGFWTAGAAGSSSTAASASGSSPSSSSSSSSSSSGASVPSLPAGVSSDGSDTIHPHQCRTPEPAAGHDDREEVIRDDDR